MTTSEPEPRTVSRRVQMAARRVVVTVLGVAVLVVGVVLIPLPGPGWAIVFGGLAILATEYAWARRWLTAARARWRRYYGEAKEAVAQRRAARAQRRSGEDGPPT